MAATRSRPSLRLTTGLILGGAALFINPGWACSSDDEWSPQWEYDEVDMRGAIEGSYVLEAEDTGQLVSVTLTQSEGRSMRRVLCENVTRSFLKRAGACDNVALSEMRLEASIESDVPEIPSGVYSALFSIEGTKLDRGELLIAVKEEWDLRANLLEEDTLPWSFRLPGGNWLELHPVPASRLSDAGATRPE